MDADALTSIRIGEKRLDHGYLLENAARELQTTDLLKVENIKVEPHYPEPNCLPFLTICNEEAEVAKENEASMGLLSVSVKPEIKTESVDLGTWEQISTDRNNRDFSCAERSMTINKLETHSIIEKVSSAIRTPSKVIRKKFKTDTEFRDQMYDTAKKFHQCNVCNRAFSRNARVKQHFFIHTGEKQYKCDISRMAYNLQAHMVIHTEKKPHVCSVCRKAYSRKSYLKQHMLLLTVEKPYVCDVCKMAFKRKSDLRRHVLIHTGETPHVCSICEMAFKRSYHLKRHMLIHTGEKRHECNVCRVAFRQKTTLQRHMLIHTGERPHECNVCKTAFKLKSDLKRHMPTHTGDKPHECSVCRMAFRQKTTLQRHMLNHTEEKPDEYVGSV